MCTEKGKVLTIEACWKYQSVWRRKERLYAPESAVLFVRRDLREKTPLRSWPSLYAERSSKFVLQAAIFQKKIYLKSLGYQDLEKIVYFLRKEII